MTRPIHEADKYALLYSRVSSRSKKGKVTRFQLNESSLRAMLSTTAFPSSLNSMTWKLPSEPDDKASRKWWHSSAVTRSAAS